VLEVPLLSRLASLHSAKLREKLRPFSGIAESARRQAKIAKIPAPARKRLLDRLALKTPNHVLVYCETLW
jgi:hypothetical protein